MIDEENRTQAAEAARGAHAAAPAHAASAESARIEPEDTVFSLPLSQVNGSHDAPAAIEEPEDTGELPGPDAPAPLGAHAAGATPVPAPLDAPEPAHAAPAHAAQPAEETPEASGTADPADTPAPAHFAEPAAAEAASRANAQLAESAEEHPTAWESTPAPAAAPQPEEHIFAESASESPASEAAEPAPDAAPAPDAPAPLHASEDTPAPSPEKTADLDEAAAQAAADAPESHTSPADTAEIDVQAVEAKLSDPGSTMSFEPLGDERIETDSTYDAGTTTQLMWGARSDVGCVRPHNEDSYLVQSPLFCVCDGMGGHAAGEVASSIAVETIAKTAPNAADPARLAAAVEAANAAVIEAAMNGLGKPGMGCTATCAYIENDTVAIAHVGDSRAYLLHEGTLIRVTRDHSYVEELVDAGEITADEARVHPNRSVITRALGSDPAMYADHFQLNIEEGDRLILCSDGLSSMVPDSEIENIATQSSTAQICVDNLVDAALAAGGHDNVTVIVVDLVDDGRVRAARRRHRRNAIIGIVAVLALLAAVGIWAFTSITGSVYLGTYKGTVAVYKGLPGKTMGLDLHWLEDTTTVKLSDLPEDTQNRLKAGIAQSSVDDALDTISKYRHQIDEEQTKQVIDAETIRQNTDQSASSEKQAEQSAEAEASDQSKEGSANHE